MLVTSEPVLVVVGLGTAAFALATSRVLTAEARRILDVHFVQVEAMRLRNKYALQVLSLQTEDAAEAPTPVKPGRSAAA